MSEEFGSRLILRGKDKSVFELFNDIPLEELEFSPRDVEDEELTFNVDRMCKVISFSNAKYLRFDFDIRKPPTSHERFTGIALSVYDDEDASIVVVELSVRSDESVEC